MKRNLVVSGLAYFVVLLSLISPVSNADASGKLSVYFQQGGIGYVSDSFTYKYGFFADSPVCSTNKEFPCVQSLSVRKIGGSKWIQMSDSGVVKEKNNCSECHLKNWKSKIGQNLPAGESAHYWMAPGFQEISMSATMSGSYTGSETDFATSPDSTYTPEDFGITLWNTSELDVPNNEYKVVMQLGPFKDALSGWFLGRMNKPQIDIDKTGLLTIQGETQNLSIAGTTIDYSQMPKEIVNEWLTSCVPISICGFETSPDTWNQNTKDETLGYLTADNSQFTKFKQWEPLMNGKAAKEGHMWSLVDFGSRGKSENTFGTCNYSTEIVGLITSNASIYSPDPPVVKDDGVQFSVASTHSKSDGSLNIGTYNVSLRKSVASCLWGKNAIQNKFEANVTYEDGSNSILTTSIKQGLNFINFNASGYHYSVPTITLRPKQTTPKAGGGTTACTNGKKTIELAKVSLSCPNGYKKA